MPVGAEPPRKLGVSQKGRRRVLFPGEASWLDMPIHDRALLASAEHLVGPAIIEQTDATTLLPQGWSAEVLAGGALLLTRTRS
jgi:N-methylhydantoinase A